MMTRRVTRFWKEKTFEEMSQEEWEALCDGCAICCLEKVQDHDTGIIWLTSSPCSYLDVGSCRCTIYDNRTAANPSCIKLTPENLSQITWLPGTCAYRIIAEGGDLSWWHPLICGDRKRVHEAGVSAKTMIASGLITCPEDMS